MPQMQGQKPALEETRNRKVSNLFSSPFTIGQIMCFLIFQDEEMLAITHLLPAGVTRARLVFVLGAVFFVAG